MFSFQALAAVTAAVVTLANANPVHGKGFSIQQGSKTKVKTSGQVAYRDALAKYGAAIPAPVVHIAAAQQSGSVTANPESYDSSYLSPVTAGGQSFNMDFDTGSSDFWLYSTLMPASEVNGQAQYNPSKSSTARRLSGETWSISYGDGSGASGVVYADKVVIGAVTATSQAVEAATSVSSSFSSDSDNDGLVGLAFSSLNTVSPDQQTTFFDTVASTLPSRLFAADLKYHAPGSYQFGYTDSSKYTGSIAYTSVDRSQGFWMFTATRTSVTSSSFSAIADTGTSLILASASIGNAYWSQVRGAQVSGGSYIFPCSATLPNFTVTIAGKVLTVPGKYLNYAPNGDGTCYGGLQTNQGLNFAILGDVFLKNQYVVFDSGNTRIGFASQ